MTQQRGAVGTRVLSRTLGLRQPASDPAQGMLPGPPNTHLPAGFAVQLAADVHRSRNGRLMLGGSPARLLRLTAAGLFRRHRPRFGGARQAPGGQWHG